MPLSARNPRVQRLRRLAHQRRERAAERAFVVEGTTLVADALAVGVALEAVFAEPGADERVLATASGAGVEVHHVEAGALTGAVSTTTPQPLAAIAPWCDVALERVLAHDLLVVLVEVADPGNAGTLLRTAEAAGAGAVLFCAGTVDPYGPKTVRASAGAIFRVPVVSGGHPVEVLDRLGAAGYQRVGTAVAGGEPYDRLDLTVPTAIVLGNEARGLGIDLVAHLDAVATVPMAGRTESLNVAITGSIMCFEARRQRRAGQETAP